MDVYARSAKAGRTVKRMDREEIIKGLEQFRSDLKPFCGSHADWERFDAGLALLKEQEPYKSKETRLNRDEYIRHSIEWR